MNLFQQAAQEWFFQTAGEETEVEAEDFTLKPLNGDSTNHVHVVERSEASGGKVVELV